MSGRCDMAIWKWLKRWECEMETSGGLLEELLVEKGGNEERPGRVVFLTQQRR